MEVVFPSSASYLLVGGLGGLGRAVSRWMVEQGARYLVYLSRTAGSTKENGGFIKELNAMGCHVECIQGSVAKIEDVQAVISRCKSPLKGVFQMSISLNLHRWPDGAIKSLGTRHGYSLHMLLYIPELTCSYNTVHLWVVKLVMNGSLEVPSGVLAPIWFGR
ncbi:hypothetical protein AFLA_002163 [Aspergillus flavus NRRL3357]|nr:hypothetical protein AFLA_002163 [Aspergillus flavus NRRL3357]